MIRSSLRPACWAALAVALAAPVAAAETHPFSVHDMVDMERVSDPVPSPDGTQVAFVLRTTDLAANRGRTDLWLVRSDGSGLRRLTSHEAGDSNPRWSPDGTIWFLSTRSGSSQVWRISPGGGEAQPVTTLPVDVSNLVVSPDGSMLAYTAEVFPDCDTLDCTKSRRDEIVARKTSGRIYDQLPIRHWDTWRDASVSHVFVQPAAGGAPKDLMKGMTVNAPPKPFGGPEEIAFTADGRSLVFTGKAADRGESWSTNSDLYLVPADGSAPPANLTAANPAADSHPLFSPDGRTLAYWAMSRPGYESDRNRIMLRSWPGGTDRVLAEAWDRSPSGMAWSKDGKTLFVVAEDLGRAPLFAVDVAGGSVRTLVDQGTVDSPGLLGDRVVYARDDLRSPAELESIGPDGKDRRILTRINAQRVAAARMGEPEQFTFSGWNNEKVHGWIVKPADFDPKQKYPVAFLIHGGPQGSFGDHFHYRWNPQAYAGAGYAAVMVDFHGSTGYGQAFTDAIRGDWGGKPLEDLKKGLDAALAKYPWMDGDRACALGASYGGYMINWIAGAWPDRFRCLVSHDGNLDERMAYFDTEELWFPEWEHGGTPWEKPDGYAKHNPIDLVKNWRTPTLVVHSALDFRVVETQGMSVFTALQRKGIPSRLLYFPDENHWVLKPHNSILWHETVLAWLDRWTKPAGSNGR